MGATGTRECPCYALSVSSYSDTNGLITVYENDRYIMFTIMLQILRGGKISYLLFTLTTVYNCEFYRVCSKIVNDFNFGNC